MIAAPYPLWVVWDEVDDDARRSHYARVLGWREAPEPDPEQRYTTPLPVVIHPETLLPATLGYDTAGSVSRMWVTEVVDAARLAVEVRRTEHGGAP